MENKSYTATYIDRDTLVLMRNATHYVAYCREKYPGYVMNISVAIYEDTEFGYKMIVTVTVSYDN